MSSVDGSVSRSSFLQIDFLNSVIVEMQRKNDELKTRLEAMESGGYTNGTSEDSGVDLRCVLRDVSASRTRLFIFVGKLPSPRKLTCAAPTRIDFIVRRSASVPVDLSATKCPGSRRRGSSVIFATCLTCTTRRTVRSRPCPTRRRRVCTTATATSSAPTVIFAKVCAPSRLA